MFPQLLRQRLGVANFNSILQTCKASSLPQVHKASPLLRTTKASSLLQPRHSFFTPSTTRKMNNTLDPITSSRLQNLQRFYHSGSGYSHYSPRSNGVMSAFYFLFTANALVFGTLNYAKYTKDWKLEKKLLGHTLLSPASWDNGRWWTVLTSAFAHIDPVHFAFNMLSLYNFCRGSAVMGGFGFLYHRKRKISESSPSDWQNKTRNYNSSALGASGAVMGIGALTACMVPNAPMQLMLIPITFPLWVFVAGYGLVDSYFLDSPNSGIAHAGHLGGLVFGTAYYLAFLRKSPMGVWRNVQRFFPRR
ncbi:hypothetical protein E4T47_04406 [Aureobasidium subglaciale]|nr:hypothetical protein E4T47_04406 [Aureobasidium subglaciale]